MPESGPDAQIPGGIDLRTPGEEASAVPSIGSTLAAEGAGTLRLRRLDLGHFRNMASLSLELRTSPLLVVGANGAGKSNLLEAVELLTSLRSHRSGHDRDLIGHGRGSGWLRGTTSCGDSLELRLHRRGGRQALRNGRLLERQLDLPGSLRCVGFSALDLDLVRGEPSRRRHWLDRVVLQLEPVYVDLLRQYNRLLRQRSHLLRRHPAAAEGEGLLDVFDQQMALIGVRLHRRRRRALLRLEPLAAAWQERLGGGAERLTLQYRSGSVLSGEEAEESWRRSLEDQLREQRSEEQRLGQCLVGPHRDEIRLLLSGTEARRYASAGQRRTLVLALKLAELDLVRQVVGHPPLLLLDDVLAELDPHRQQLLLEAVGEGHQCLVSATHLDAFMGGWRERSQVVEMRGGSLHPCRSGIRT